MSKKLPPLIQQFVDIQNTYPDAIVATEVGGFFEIWQLHDQSVGHAIRASQLLDTVLTKRNKADPESPYMTGFPSYVGPDYFKKLVEKGETVVVVEQHIRGRKADGNKNVVREVSQILSPGITLDQLKDNQNNFFASVFMDDEACGVCVIDVSTGEVKITETTKSQLSDLLMKLSPREILFSQDKIEVNLNAVIHENTQVIKKTAHAGQILGTIYEVSNPSSNDTYPLIALDLEYHKLGALSLANLLNYLASTEYNKLLLKKISRPQIYNQKDYLKIPFNSFLSLEAFESQKQKESDFTLLKTMDHCKTSMGKRKLIQWIKQPLSDEKLIQERLDSVEKLLKNNKFFPEMKNVYDLNRISRKMIFGRLLPHEIIHLYQSLNIIHDILVEEKSELKKHSLKSKKHILSNIDLSKAEITTASTNYDFLSGDLAALVQEDLEKWKLAEEKLLNYVSYLKKELGTDKLRLVEKTESFFLVGPKGLKSSAEHSGIKIQLKANDVSIIDEKFERLSLECFGLRQSFKLKARQVWENFQKNFHTEYGSELLEISEFISTLDVLSNFAFLAKERGYCKPKIVKTSRSHIKFLSMRHPVVEQAPNLTEAYVPNDVVFDKHRTLVIYGANSAGKSTILKAVALNIILASMGSFIACAEGSEMSTFDSIQTRITSFDSLSEGLSTFTQEMTELSVALRSYSSKTLFLLDEIGRGTSVEDGEAIAFGTLTYLDKSENNSLSLFATHYHELYEQIKLIKSIEVKNLLCFRSPKGELIFSRKLEDGRGNGSYGIEVARSCGLPEEIIRSAENYAKDFAPLKISRYNKKVSGSLCPICSQNPVQETHHIVEQKQGTVETIEDQGMIRSINHPSNLLMICSSCHEKITRGQLEVTRAQSAEKKTLIIKEK